MFCTFAHTHTYTHTDMYAGGMHIMYTYTYKVCVCVCMLLCIRLDCIETRLYKDIPSQPIYMALHAAALSCNTRKQSHIHTGMML